MGKMSARNKAIVRCVIALQDCILQYQLQKTFRSEITMVSTFSKHNNVLSPDVLNFFEQKKDAFGCMNLLPNHLPNKQRTTELVKNVIAVDFAIACAFGMSEYIHYIQRFCDRHFEFATHLADLMGLSKPRLAVAFDEALGATMDTINIFSPKQCNLACRGCYTASKSVVLEPYSEDFIESYYSAVKATIAQARELGARTIYTSGDGEITTFPKFFDLLDYVASNGMQWLFFTAGLIFSSETAAQKAWQDVQKYASPEVVKRLTAAIENSRSQASKTPTAMAFLAELARYKDHIQVYHSVWSTSDRTNSLYRNPLTGNYQYKQVDVRGTSIMLPSSIDDMLAIVFDGDNRERFGVQMPVGSFNIHDVANVATYVADRNIKSYFEPIITTGRNKHNDLEAPPKEELAGVAPLLVRELCSFRNVHQPTVKVSSSETGEAQLFCSPGMGIDLKDLSDAGVLEPLRIKVQPNGLFTAIHAPLMVYTNFSYSIGCKCNDFGVRLTSNREDVWREWQKASLVLSDTTIKKDVIKEWLATHSSIPGES
jgi:MoaA/NifB/PqqE/SkfB family radical SAM enzyme